MNNNRNDLLHRIDQLRREMAAEEDILPMLPQLQLRHPRLFQPQIRDPEVLIFFKEN